MRTALIVLAIVVVVWVFSGGDVGGIFGESEAERMKRQKADAEAAAGKGKIKGEDVAAVGGAIAGAVACSAVGAAPAAPLCAAAGAYVGKKTYNYVKTDIVENINPDNFTQLKSLMCSCYRGQNMGLFTACQLVESRAPGISAHCKYKDCDCNPTNPKPNVVRYRDSKGGPYETRFK